MKRPPLPVNREVTHMTATTRKPSVISNDPPTTRTAPLRDNISGFLPGSCCFLLYRKDEGEEQCVSFSPILLPGCLYGTMTTRGSLKAPDFLFPFLGTDIPRDLQLPCCEIG